MTASMVRVYVDARNLLHAADGLADVERVIDACCSYASTTGHEVIVVVDGQSPGGARGEHRMHRLCSVVSTGALTADTYIESAIAAGAAGEIWVVTSDNALRDAVGQATRRIDSAAFATELQSTLGAAAERAAAAATEKEGAPSSFRATLSQEQWERLERIRRGHK